MTWGASALFFLFTNPADFGLRGFFSPAFFARALIVVPVSGVAGRTSGAAWPVIKPYNSFLIVVSMSGVAGFDRSVVRLFYCSVVR
jgi:hypothetical protein